MKVIEAKDGVEAVERAKKVMPDLILMDIRMPGLSGFQAFDELQKDNRTSSIPVVACTASAFIATENEALKKGRNNFV